jgi:hypothetical protein
MKLFINKYDDLMELLDSQADSVSLDEFYELRNLPANFIIQNDVNIHRITKVSSLTKLNQADTLVWYVSLGVRIARMKLMIGNSTNREDALVFLSQKKD